MNIANLIEEVGVEEVMVQNLDVCFSNIKVERGGFAEITFSTEEVNVDEFIKQTGRVGIVVWMDRDKFNTTLNTALNMSLNNTK